MAQQICFPEFEAADAAERESRKLAAAQRGGVARPWGDPSEFEEIIGVDFGGGAMFAHELLSGRDIGPMKAAAAMEYICSRPRKTLVVSEDAHLAVPQQEHSLAQPFTEAELLEIGARCQAAGVTLLLFPAAHSYKARAWAAENCPDKEFVGAEKTTDANDARALAFYVRHRNGVSLRKPVVSFGWTRRRMYGRAVAKASNVVLAAERNTQYDGSRFAHVAEMSHRLLSTPAGRGSAISIVASFSIVSKVMYELESRPVRFVFNGRTPGRDMWMKEVARNSPSHRKAGIARSNMNRHVFRAFLVRFAADRGVAVKEGNSLVSFGRMTDEQDQVVREAWREFRRQTREAYSAVVAMSAGFPPFEVVDDPRFGRPHA